MSRHGTPRGASGVTLIELLVALVIFAIMSAIAYASLDTLLQSRARLDARSESLAGLQLAFTVLGRDIEQAVNRPVRDEFGDRQVTMAGTDSELEFTRAGWRNPAGLRRSELQRVGYHLADEELRRVTWRVLDRTQGSEPSETVLLSGVSAFELRFLDQQDEWASFWPPADVAAPGRSPLPRAIQVTLETEQWGRVTRLFRTVGAVPFTPDAGAPSAGGTPGPGTGIPPAGQAPETGDASEGPLQ